MADVVSVPDYSRRPWANSLVPRQWLTYSAAPLVLQARRMRRFSLFGGCGHTPKPEKEWPARLTKEKIGSYFKEDANELADTVEMASLDREMNRE